MKFVSAQPATTYFAWQLAVQLTNFKSIGINLSDCHVLLAKQGDISEPVFHLIGLFPEVNFHIVPDRKNRKYVSSVRFFLLDHLQQTHPSVFQEAVFYHDSDILFTRYPEFSHLAQENIWYASDTRSYLSADYILARGKGLLENMAAIVGIDPMKVMCNNQQAGGAQYIFNGVPNGFFASLELKSEKLYHFLRESKGTYKLLHMLISHRNDYHPIQEWCADMWVLFWSALSKDIRFEISPDLNFCFATDPIEKLANCSIYHDAGVTDKTPHLFRKSNYRTSCPDDTVATDARFCSQYYVDAIKQAPCL